MTRHAITALQLVLFSWVTLVAFPALAQPVPHTFIYEPSTGNFSLDNEGPLLTTLEIRSASGVFTGTMPSNCNIGLFDLCTKNKYFKIFPAGFDDIDFGPMVAPGLSVDFLTSDLSFGGSRLPSGQLGATQIVASEPTTWILHYDPTNGSIGLENPTLPPTNNRLTTVVIDSASGFFTGQRPADLRSDFFDIFRADRAFKLQVDGFTSLDWPQAAATGRTDQQLADDLCIAGSFVGGGALLGVHVNRADGPLLRTCPTLPDLGGPVDPDVSHGIVLTYFSDGRVQLFTNGNVVSTLEIQSPDGIFTGERPSQVNGLFDVFNPNKLFVLNTSGFGDQDFGLIATPNLSREFISNLRVAGAILPQGSLGNVQIVYAGIPEPASWTLVTIGILPIVDRLRRRQGRTSIGGAS